MSKQDQSEILVPFIGAFSSGKSSLINALLGEGLLSTDIMPETALPIELRAGDERRFLVNLPNTNPKELTEAVFKEADFSAFAQQDGWISVNLPTLNSWPNMVLVDLPGWSSGESQHERHIDEYLANLAKKHLDKNTLFVLAVSADEGTLRDNVRERLQQLDIGSSPYLLVITKSDKRSAQDLDKITEHLLVAISQVLGKAPKHVLRTSARKKEVQELHQALAAMLKEINKPSVDRAAVARLIEQHLKNIAEAESDRRDQAIYIFDEVWDEFADNLLDEHCDFVMYGIAKARGDSLNRALGEVYRKTLMTSVQRNFPRPSADLLAQLEQIDLSAPDTTDMQDTVPLLNQRAKKHIYLAIEKAKPGIFASDDPEAVGSRIRSKLRDCRKEFRSDIIDCSYTSLSTWLERQTEQWQRLLRLIA